MLNNFACKDICIYVYMYNVFVCAVYVCEGVRALINSNVCVCVIDRERA